MATNSSTVRSLPRIVAPQDSVTRPADTTQYAAGDAISDNATTATAAGAFTLPVASRPGGGGRIMSATLHKSQQSSTSADFDILLFDTLPAVAGWEDNAACAITDAEGLTIQARLRFVNTGWTNMGTGSVQTIACDYGFVCTSAEANLYGIAVAQGTYTPASGEVFTLTLHARQD